MMLRRTEKEEEKVKREKLMKLEFDEQSGDDREGKH